MSIFPRRTLPGATVILHVRLERPAGPRASWAVHAVLTGPDGRVRARFTDGGEVAPGPTRIDRWFAWQSTTDDALGRFDVDLVAAIGGMSARSGTAADDHVLLECLKAEGGRLRNLGPEPVPACLLAQDGTPLADIVVPAFDAVDVPEEAAFARWADGRLLALQAD